MKLDIRQGDCAELMTQMDADSVNLTVTSPPYDNLRTYNGYSFNFEAVAKELYRVTKPGGVVVWVVGDATVNGSETGTSFRQALFFKECGFNLHDTMIWRKTNAPPQTKEGRRYTLAHEYMFVFTKGRVGTFNPIMQPCTHAGLVTFNGTNLSPDGSRREDRAQARSGKVVNAVKPLQSVWDCAANGRSTGHPAAFPEKLVRDHVLSWSNPGDIVLDPFTGSGTTGKIAIQEARRFVGVEISPEYCELARQRIRAAIPQAANDGDPVQAICIP